MWVHLEPDVRFGDSEFVQQGSAYCSGASTFTATGSGGGFTVERRGERLLMRHVGAREM